VNESDAWAVVMYIRVLQASWVDPKDVPEDQRPQLEKTRPASPPTDGKKAAAPGATGAVGGVTMVDPTKPSGTEVNK
jgi:hypothetical protein